MIKIKASPLSRADDGTEYLTGEIRLSGIAEESVVDGEGIRLTVFVQGCPHRCDGCQNPHTHALGGGEITPLNNIARLIKKNPLLRGVTYSGGEPFLYPDEFIKLSRFVKQNGMDVWCYTGYTFEELKTLSAGKPQIAELLGYIDVLVDGRYEKDNKPYPLVFKGSLNQRIIDLNRMRKEKTEKIILMEI